VGNYVKKISSSKNAPPPPPPPPGYRKTNRAWGLAAKIVTKQPETGNPNVVMSKRLTLGFSKSERTARPG